MNWGKALIISMTIFIVFIVGLGFYMVNNNDSLYEKDYYQKGEAHTETMEAEEIAANVKMDYHNPLLVIQLGEDGQVDKVVLKHMGNSKFDRVLSNGTKSVMDTYTLEILDLQAGIWYIEVTGVLKGKPFFKKTKLVI